MTETSGSERLESWKAIARYLGRSVRTVRRWEQHEGLPVHRLQHQSQASVYAFPAELDAWRRERAQAPAAMARPALGEPAGPQASIAVLPFTFAGPDQRQAWVAEGFTEEMINGFSSLTGLRVTSRTSSFAVRDGDRDTSEIARLLGVAHLLEGSVVGDGQRLRITIRLIDAVRDEHRWSRQFVGTMDEVFEIQERIARAVVAALQLRLGAAEERRLQHRGLDDVRAWRRVVEARREALRWHPEALERARLLLTEALEIAGEHAEILASIGRVLLNYREAGVDTSDELLAEAEAWSERALAADPEAAGALVLAAWLDYARGALGPAIQRLERALEHDRDQPDALGLLINCLLLTGQSERAEPVIAHIMAVDPLTPLTRCMPGFAAAMAGRFEDAAGPYREMLAQDPHNPLARLFNVWVLHAAGDHAAAKRTVAGFDPAARASPAALLANLLTAAASGAIDEATLPPEAVALAERVELFARFAAEAYAMAGRPRDAARWLNAAIDLGFANYPYLAQHAPWFAALAGDPAFDAALDRAEARWRTLAKAGAPVS